MLTDSSDPDKSSPILNLFDNEDAPDVGSSLIRYRVAEYLNAETRVDLGHQRPRSFFIRLGYDLDRVKKVLVRMLMAAMVYSERGLDPKRLDATEVDSIGPLVFTDTGKAYFSLLLQKLWYYLAARQGLAPRLPQHRVRFDTESNTYYVTHTDFIEHLREEEEAEGARAREWDRHHGMKVRHPQLSSPHRLAKKILFAEG